MRRKRINQMNGTTIGSIMIPSRVVWMHLFGSLKHDHQDVETNEQLDRKWFKHLLLLKELLLV